MSNKKSAIKGKIEEKTNQIDQRIFFSLLERAGGMGKYQYVVIIVISIINYLGGGLILIPPYLFFQDPYSCSPIPD